jgi:hypothetical protein
MAKRHIATGLWATPFRWPTAGDQLFEASGDVQEVANLNSPFGPTIWRMAEGYKSGSDILVDHALEVRFDHERDRLSFPIVFGYRHFIELSLKHILAEYGPHVGVKPNWRSHNLMTLWASVVNVLDAYGTIDPDDADEAVFSCIVEFSKIDPNSFSFRYPTDRTGSLIAFDENNLNLGTLKETVDGLANYFEACSDYIDDLLKPNRT